MGTLVPGGDSGQKRERQGLGFTHACVSLDPARGLHMHSLTLFLERRG